RDVVPVDAGLRPQRVGRRPDPGHDAILPDGENRAMPRCIDWRDGAVVLIDQTRLPAEECWLRITDVDALVACIARLAVRGAPALGAAGALGVALAATAAARTVGGAQPSGGYVGERAVVVEDAGAAGVSGRAGGGHAAAAEGGRAVAGAG